MLDGVRISNFIRGFLNPRGFGFSRGSPLGDNHIEEATKIDKHKITKMSNIDKKIEINLPNKNWSEFHPKQNKKKSTNLPRGLITCRCYLSSTEHCWRANNLARCVNSKGTIPILREHIFGLFGPHPPTLSA